MFGRATGREVRLRWWRRCSCRKGIRRTGSETMVLIQWLKDPNVLHSVERQSCMSVESSQVRTLRKSHGRCIHGHTLKEESSQLAEQPVSSPASTIHLDRLPSPGQALIHTSKHGDDQQHSRSIIGIVRGTNMSVRPVQALLSPPLTSGVYLWARLWIHSGIALFGRGSNSTVRTGTTFVKRLYKGGN